MWVRLIASPELLTGQETVAIERREWGNYNNIGQGNYNNSITRFQGLLEGTCPIHPLATDRPMRVVVPGPAPRSQYKYKRRLSDDQ